MTPREEVWYRVVRAKDEHDRRTGLPSLVSKRFEWTTSNGGGWHSPGTKGAAGFEVSTFYGVGFAEEGQSPVEAARARAWREGWRLAPAEAVEAELAKAADAAHASREAFEAAARYEVAVAGLASLGLKARES